MYYTLYIMKNYTMYWYFSKMCKYWSSRIEMNQANSFGAEIYEKAKGA